MSLASYSVSLSPAVSLVAVRATFESDALLNPAGANQGYDTESLYHSADNAAIEDGTNINSLLSASAIVRSGK